MHIFHFQSAQPPISLESIEQLPDEGFVWVDYLRSEAKGWEQLPTRLLGVRIDSEHIEDSHNSEHVSNFDGTSDYDLLIFEGLGPSQKPVPVETRSAAFFIFDRVLVTVRAADAPSFDVVIKRCMAQSGKQPRGPVGLVHRILDAMVDRFLAVRETYTRYNEALQDDLLHSREGNLLWRRMIRARRAARRLASMSEDQWETIENWRRDSRFDWDDIISVRLRDLSEHITRIRDLASNLERDLEGAIQLNFAILSQRQNEIMKVFTVVAVIFMPLTLLTGIWGMNFQYMPELHWEYGYLFALLVLLVCGVGMFFWFRRRHFF